MSKAGMEMKVTPPEKMSECSWKNNYIKLGVEKKTRDKLEKEIEICQAYMQRDSFCYKKKVRDRVGGKGSTPFYPSLKTEEILLPIYGEKNIQDTYWKYSTKCRGWTDRGYRKNTVGGIRLPCWELKHQKKRNRSGRTVKMLIRFCDWKKFQNLSRWGETRLIVFVEGRNTHCFNCVENGHGRSECNPSKEKQN